MLWNDEVKDFVWENKRISMYEVKRNIIQNNIFWVDISPWAIDIARLRFWLSLIVDEELNEKKEIKPLPNFEFKFVCANTLIPLEEEQKQWQLELDWVKEKKAETVKRYMNSYYNAQNKIEKDKLISQIESYLWFWKNLIMDLYNTKSQRTKQLETYEPFNPNHSAEFFDPSLMMWNNKFDIVIWNPPYVNIYDIDNKLKKEYSKFKTAYQKYDLYVLFYEKWIDLLKQWWNICFITSNKFLSQWYWLKLRQLFLIKQAR